MTPPSSDRVLILSELFTNAESVRMLAISIKASVRVTRRMLSAKHPRKTKSRKSGRNTALFLLPKRVAHASVP